MSKPTVLITAGDPLGIGPEIVVKALHDTRVQHACTPVVIGEPLSLQKAGFTENLAALIPIDIPQNLSGAPRPTAIGGRVSFQAVETGIKLALKTGCPLITAPISKQSWALAGVPFTGHTELLRARTGADGLMMFCAGNIRCALVTEHFAVADLPHLLTKTRVQKSAQHFIEALRKMGIKKPHVVLCALNPHASDNGQFGTEENKVLAPIVRALQKQGFHVQGPLPTDAAWLSHIRGKYDGILCMYHDQALLGLKLAAKEPAVHITAGLPFLRVSPTHGTAFDIAGQNKANSRSMIQAVLFAVTHQ
ncbi:MAG: 4-hydroxythreonine-4-phosphate dehydrogenase PdxA [Elusimicrobiaceae bacterium]|nr:4-hydroxythreonine-4-phosphate dehydrogenase PdxA [Elusimicrobiaceae bacterium]